MLKVCTLSCVAVAVWACGDGQAEDDYLGEPLFTAHGSVVSSELPVNRELILSLRFDEWGPPPRTGVLQHYLKAEVVGSFPSAFTMRIYEPPPPSAIVATVPGEPPFATGALVTVRPDHPDWLRQQTFYEGSEPTIVRTCANDGECRDHDLRLPPCGSPPDYRPCPTDDAWTNYGSAAEYSFVYLAQEAPAGSVLSRYFSGGQPIGKGYHLLIDSFQLQDSDAADAFRVCATRAEQRAYAVINTRHGREPGADLPAVDPAAFEVEFPGELIVASVAEGCERPDTRWVDDPNAVSLTLSLNNHSMSIP